MTRGEWAAFNDPTLGDGGSKPADERDVFVGFCYAAPGDSLWIDSVGNVSLRRPAGRQACRKLELPRRNVWQSVTSDNALWYAHTISLHEGKHASVVSGVLCVEGRPVKGYRFRHDYYWMSSANRHNPDDSRTFGFVPDTYLIGRLGHVIYSVDPIAPWYAPLRGGRMMMEVSRENLKP